ncbi:MAG: hypothetical protein HN453_13765 [Gammaproteobacteria bacterium]|jgi:hypothetical protein|nr:hypothetical protein [Gammaproteobacteria bacterium]
MSAAHHFLGHAVVQVAYHVPDIEAAAIAMANQTGAGPFFVSRNIVLAHGEHRGEPCPFVHSSAYGQWGAVMVEFVQQDSQGPSPFRDLYQAHERGLHHMAVMTTDIEASYQHFEDHGMPRVTRAVTDSGVEFAFLDALDTLGHFIEIYEASPQLLGFYDFVRTAAVDWQGEAPIRSAR